MAKPNARHCALGSDASAPASTTRYGATLGHRPGRTTQGRLCIQRARLTPEPRHFGTATPGPNNTLRPTTPSRHGADRARPKHRREDTLDTKRLRSALAI